VHHNTAHQMVRNWIIQISIRNRVKNPRWTPHAKWIKRSHKRLNVYECSRTFTPSTNETASKHRRERTVFFAQGNDSRIKSDVISTEKTVRIGRQAIVRYRSKRTTVVRWLSSGKAVVLVRRRRWLRRSLFGEDRSYERSRTIGCR